MAENTAIEWCDDSISFWHGCTKIASGCSSCYAEGMSKRWGLDIWGPNKPRLFIASAVATLKKINSKAEREGKPRIVFINSMSDFFEEHNGPVVNRAGQRLCCGPHCPEYYAREPRKAREESWLTIADLRTKAFALFDQLKWLRLLLLTKRPENVRRMWTRTHGFPGDQCADVGPGVETDHYWHRPNVWLGFSASTQADLDAGLPHLLACRDLCPVLFLSLEPLLGQCEIVALLNHVRGQFTGNGHCCCCGAGPFETARNTDGGRRHLAVCPGQKSLIGWVIVGGESGPRARPCNVDWIRSVVRQCKDAGVSCFVKQLGSKPMMRADSYEGRMAGDHPEREWPLGTLFGTAMDHMGTEWQGRHAKLRDGKGGDMDEFPEDLRIREWPRVCLTTS